MRGSEERVVARRGLHDEDEGWEERMFDLPDDEDEDDDSFGDDDLEEDADDADLEDEDDVDLEDLDDDE
jgi:ribonuclease E